MRNRTRTGRTGTSPAVAKEGTVETTGLATGQAQFISGLKAIAPILLGVVPFATIAGIAAVEIGLSPELAIGMSLLMFAGAAQLAAIQLLALDASPFIIILTALIINLRFVMYSASLAPHLKQAAPRLKALLAYLLTDQAYAVSISQFTREPARRGLRHWFYLGAALAMWLTWQTGAALGALLGTQVPESWSLDFAIPLTFLALAIPTIKDRATLAAALGGGMVAVAAFSLPYNLGLIGGAVAGISLGVWLESRLSTPGDDHS